MPGDPKQCREQAKHCLKLAAQTSSPLAKARFEDLAQTWLRLASVIERTRALVAHWGSPNDASRRDKARG